MPLYVDHKFDTPCVRIAVWFITENPEQLVDSIPHGETLLIEAESRFRSASRRLEWLAIRRLLHELIGRTDICYSADGKPYLPPFGVSERIEDNYIYTPDDCLLTDKSIGDCMNNSPYISISHTRNYAAVALSELPVGLDIEQRTERVLKVRSRFVSPLEEKDFVSSSALRQLNALLLLWSAKETMYKLLDNPELDFVQNLEAQPFCLHDEWNPYKEVTPLESIVEFTEADSLPYFEACTREVVIPDKKFRIHYHFFPDFVLTVSLFD